MSDFVGLRETFLKAYTESQNDTSYDDVLKELPSIFLTTKVRFFDEDDHECNRAVLVRLKLEGKLEHKFDTSTAFDYITSTRDALDQCKRDLHVNAGPDTMTTLDNNLYTAPEIFKPGFEFLQKTQQDVDTLCAAMPERNVFTGTERASGEEQRSDERRKTA